jgi:hypothetical protein
MKVTLEGALSLLSKSKYTVQHFIDQHPALFAAIFLFTSSPYGS